MKYNQSKPYINYELIINEYHEFLYNDGYWGHEALKARLFKENEAHLFISKYDFKKAYAIPLYDTSWNFAENTYFFLDGSEEGDKKYEDLNNIFFKINNHLIEHDLAVVEDGNSKQSNVNSIILDELL